MHPAATTGHRVAEQIQQYHDQTASGPGPLRLNLILTVYAVPPGVFLLQKGISLTH
jgi:hypothetical protein